MNAIAQTRPTTPPSAAAAATVRYRVRGPLAEEAVLNAAPGTLFARTSFDHRSKAFLEVREDGYSVWHEGFKKGYWEWRETPEVRREFPAGAGAEACRYFNFLNLSPGYLGPVKLELEEA